ncbi:MAG: hypothetical protein RRY35_07470, partial [Clostridiales bacterium]
MRNLAAKQYGIVSHETMPYCFAATKSHGHGFSVNNRARGGIAPALAESRTVVVVNKLRWSGMGKIVAVVNQKGG